MKKAWLIAALALLPTQSFSLTTICNHYVAWHYPSIKLVETDKRFIVTYDKWTDTMDKTILKPFGVLTDGGVEMDVDGHPTHAVVRDNIGGEPVLIVDSIIFRTACR